MGSGKFLFHCIPTDIMFHTSPLRDVLKSLVFFDNWQNTGCVMQLSAGHCIKEGAWLLASLGETLMAGEMSECASCPFFTPKNAT